MSKWAGHFLWVTLRHCQCLHYRFVRANGTITDGREFGKNLVVKYHDKIEIIAQHLPGRNFSQYCPCFRGDMDRKPPKYESRALPLCQHDQLRQWIWMYRDTGNNTVSVRKVCAMRSLIEPRHGGENRIKWNRKIGCDEENRIWLSMDREQWWSFVIKIINSMIHNNTIIKTGYNLPRNL
jgi:hypothetical protein